MKRFVTPLIVGGLVAVALLVGIVVGGQVGAVRDAVDDVFGSSEGNATGQAIDVIRDDYFHTVDEADLENSSIGSIVNHLKERYDDRFSHYFTPAEYERFQQGARLAGFFPGAHGELREKVESLYDSGAQGIVLDLRGNGGGLLTEAILVSSIFVPDGRIVSTHGRTQQERTFD